MVMEITKSINEIISKDCEIRKINDQPFVFLEGPVWDKKNQRLYFTDPLDLKIICMNDDETFSVVHDNSGYANGMCINKEGNLIICKMDTGSIDEIEPRSGMHLSVVAQGYQGKPFNATNDVICDEKGGYYITDPFFTYGPQKQELEATYYHSAEGKTIRVATDSKKPNGLALSPDGKCLYIDDTGSINVWKYEVKQDGTLKQGEIFCKIYPPQDISDLPPVQHFGEADGMKVDSAGNVYITTYTGIQIFNQIGEYLGKIEMPGTESAANLVFGGRDLKTHYITARTSLYAIDVLIPGY